MAAAPGRLAVTRKQTFTEVLCEPISCCGLAAASFI